MPLSKEGSVATVEIMERDRVMDPRATLRPTRWSVVRLLRAAPDLPQLDGRAAA